jgi:hypothetical protein
VAPWCHMGAQKRQGDFFQPNTAKARPIQQG